MSRAPSRKVRRRTPEHVLIVYPEGDVEVREKYRRVGYRVTFAQLHTILAMRAAGIVAKGRKARRVR